MTSQTKKLACKGILQSMEYKEVLVHNVLAIAQNVILFIAKKVKDNVLCMMAVLVIFLQTFTPQNPVAKPLCA